MLSGHYMLAVTFPFPQHAPPSLRTAAPASLFLPFHSLLHPSWGLDSSQYQASLPSAPQTPHNFLFQPLSQSLT